MIQVEIQIKSFVLKQFIKIAVYLYPRKLIALIFAVNLNYSNDKRILKNDCNIEQEQFYLVSDSENHLPKCQIHIVADLTHYSTASW